VLHPSAPALRAARALNRAMLARQYCWSAPMPAIDAIGHLGGMQAQAPLTPSQPRDRRHADSPGGTARGAAVPGYATAS